MLVCGNKDVKDAGLRYLRVLGPLLREGGGVGGQMPVSIKIPMMYHKHKTVVLNEGMKKCA